MSVTMTRPIWIKLPGQFELDGDFYINPSFVTGFNEYRINDDVLLKIMMAGGDVRNVRCSSTEFIEKCEKARKYHEDQIAQSNVN